MPLLSFSWLNALDVFYQTKMPQRAPESRGPAWRIAAGLTYRVREHLAAYGGAFYLLLRGDYESTLTRWDLEGDDSFGMFASLDWRAKEDARWDAEFRCAEAIFVVAMGRCWIVD